MKYEKIIRRENGMQYQICINAYLDSFGLKPMQYKVYVYYREKGKRKWLNIDKDIPDHVYRKLSMDERREYDKKNNLRFVSKDEIYEAKLDLWNLFKPKM
jgi:hypothetical protein